jgi:hypothetical protein
MFLRCISLDAERYGWVLNGCMFYVCHTYASERDSYH